MRKLLIAAMLLTGCNSTSAATTNVAATPGPVDAAVAANGQSKVAIRVTKEGFVPSEVKVPQGKPVTLEFTRETTSECLKAIRVPWRDGEIDLPMNQPVAVTFDAAKAGTLTYACWMNMIFGKITVTPN